MEAVPKPNRLPSSAHLNSHDTYACSGHTDFRFVVHIPVPSAAHVHSNAD